MKKYIHFILSCSLLLSHITQAQTKAEIKVGASVETLRLALISGNQKELEKLVAKKLSYGHAWGYVESKEEFIEKLVSKKSDFVGITLDDQVISVTLRTAIVRHIFSVETKDNNKPGRVKLKEMLVFSKRNGHWKLLARQAIKAP